MRASALRLSEVWVRFGTLCAKNATAALLVACFSGDPDLSAASGAYALEAVDNIPLPVAIAEGDCPYEISDGDMGLSPQIGSREPLFTTLIFLRLKCDPGRTLPTDINPHIRDFGEWTVIGNYVQFRSENGYGNQLVPMEAPPPGVIGPLLTLDLGGRRYTFRRIRLHGEPL